MENHAGAAGPDQTLDTWTWNLSPGLLTGSSSSCWSVLVFSVALLLKRGGC